MLAAGPYDTAEWLSLPDAVTLVRREAFDRALALLSDVSAVRLTPAEADALTGASRIGENLYLVRAGVVSGPGVRFDEYFFPGLRHVRFGATWNRQNGSLLVESFQLSRFDFRRNVPVVVSVPGPVSDVIVGCRFAQ